MAQDTVRNIIRVADALDAMAAGENRLAGIARRLGVSRSSAHRILKSMEATGLAIQDPVNGGYYIGQRIMGLLSSTAAIHQYLSVRVRLEIRDLAEEIEETVSIVVRAGLEKVVLEEVLGGRNVKISVGQGFASTLALGATGRVLMAQLEQAEAEALLPLLFEGGGPERIEAARTQIASVARAGHDISFGEYLRGVCAIAVPIRGYATPVALSVLTNVDSYEAERSKRLVARMQETAAAIEGKLAPTQSATEREMAQ